MMLFALRSAVKRRQRPGQPADVGWLIAGEAG
jgi:hypothetical protein